MTCNQTCRYRGKHSDAARRISDATKLGWVANGWDGFVGHWMVFKLEDGDTDHVLYPRKIDAVRSVSNEFHYLYLRMHVEGMGLCEAEIMLEFHRSAYKAGFRLSDPDSKTGGPDIIPRIGSELIGKQLSTLWKAGG